MRYEQSLFYTLLGVPLSNTSVLFYAHVIALLCLPAAKHEQQDNLNDDDDVPVHNDEKSKYSNYLNHDNDIELM